MNRKMGDISRLFTEEKIQMAIKHEKMLKLNGNHKNAKRVLFFLLIGLRLPNINRGVHENTAFIEQFDKVLYEI